MPAIKDFNDAYAQDLYEEDFNESDDDTEEEDVEETEEEDNEDDADNEETVEPDKGKDSDIQSDETGTEETPKKRPEYEFPQWTPDELKPPKEFKDEKEELAWYKDNYTKPFEQYKTDEFRDRLLNTYKDQLLSVEQEHEQLKAVSQVFKNNPELAVKLYAPQYLAQKGYNNIITEEEKNDIADKALKTEFGEDYKNHYDRNAASNPNTLSGRMLLKQEEIYRTIEQQNNTAKQYIEQYQPSEEVQKQQLEKEYETYFKPNNLTKEDFDLFNNNVKEHFTKNPINSMDLSLIMNKDYYLKEAYNNGFKEGQKKFHKEIEKVGNEVKPTNDAPKKNGKAKSDYVFDERHPYGERRRSNPFI